MLLLSETINDLTTQWGKPKPWLSSKASEFTYLYLFYNYQKWPPFFLKSVLVQLINFMVPFYKWLPISGPLQDFPNLTTPLMHQQHLSAHNFSINPCGLLPPGIYHHNSLWPKPHSLWLILCDSAHFLTAAEGLLWSSDLIPTPWPS